MKLNNVLLGTLLGDSYLGKGTGNVFSFRVSHCPEQLDYLEHLVEVIKNNSSAYKSVSVYFRQKRNIHELYYYNPDLKESREKYYPNDKKCIKTILDDITDPIQAVAYWMADDGCVHYSTKNKTYLSPRLLIATCSETEETHNYIISWFEKHFNLTPYITKQRNYKRNKEWLLIKFTVGDSYKLWQKIRHYLLPIPSMKYKFRVVEQEFNREFYRIKYSQERSSTRAVENVRRTTDEEQTVEVMDKKP